MRQSREKPWESEDEAQTGEQNGFDDKVARSWTEIWTVRTLEGAANFTNVQNVQGRCVEDEHLKMLCNNL